MAPGGPFDAEKAVPPEVLKSLNERYNLDAPVIVQYKDYMLNLLQGDFGPSFRYPSRSVTEMIFTGMPVTFELAFYAILVALIIGIFAGVLAAVKRNTALDYIPMTIAMIGICMPTFLLGPLLVLFFWNSFRAFARIWMGYLTRRQNSAFGNTRCSLRCLHSTP